MPTYHFDVKAGTNDNARAIVEFENLAEAKCEALKIAGTAIRDASGTFWDNPEWMLIVTDDAGLTLFQLQVLGAEGLAERNLSRVGFGEGTYDDNKKSDEDNVGVDGC